MTQSQQAIINALNIALFHKADMNITVEDWIDFFNEVKEHEVIGIVFDALLKSNKIRNTAYFETFLKASLVESFHQIQQIEVVKKVLKQLTDNITKVLVLKGFELRRLYPKPEMRTMCDVDIMVEKDQLQKVKNILVGLGYEARHHQGDIHYQFIKEKCLSIEVHLRLVNESNNTILSDFEKNIWNYTELCTAYDIPFYTLRQEENFIFLVLHLAKHIVYTGFGIRQVCDIALFIENHEGLDWMKIIQYAKSFHIEKFLYAVLSVCTNLFQIQVPGYIKEFRTKNRKFIASLLDTIFDSGVYGYKTATRVLVNKMTKYQLKTKYEVKNIFCPDTELVLEKFKYAKKNKLLYPIAWCSWVIWICVKKIKTFIQTNRNRMVSKENLSSKKIYRQRVQLVKWLELK